MQTDLGSFAESWADFMLRGLVDGSVVFLVVLLLWLPLRRLAPAHLVSGVFLLVLAKLVFPFQIEVPGWLAALYPSYLLEHAFSEWAAEPLAAAGELPVTTVLLAPVTAPGPEAVAGPSSQVWLLLAWVAVVGALLSRFALVQLRTRRTVERARHLRDAELPVDLSGLLDAAGIRRPVRFLVSDALGSPAAGGLLKPYVLIPEGLIGQLPARQMSWVLLHELAHIKRGDLWVSLVQRLVQIAFFFHPVVWLANWIIDEQREYACDDAALAWSKARRQECGQGFLSLIEWSQDRSAVPATLGMFGSHTVIRRRLMRILDHRRKLGRSTAASSSFLLAMALLVLPTVTAQSRTAEQEPPVAQDPPILQAARSDAPPQDPPRARLNTLRQRLERLERENEALRRQLESLRSGDRVSRGNRAPRAVPQAPARPDRAAPPTRQRSRTAPPPVADAPPPPRARPNPDARPAPRARPNPDARPTPRARPNPDARPAPRARPNPDARPTPRNRPRPDVRPPAAPRTPRPPAGALRDRRPEQGGGAVRSQGGVQGRGRARADAPRRVTGQGRTGDDRSEAEVRALVEEEMRRVREEVQRVQREAQAEMRRIQEEVRRLQREAQAEVRRAQQEVAEEVRRVQAEARRVQQQAQQEVQRAQREAQAEVRRVQQEVQRAQRAAAEEARRAQGRIQEADRARAGRREADREAEERRGEARERRRDAEERSAEAGTRRAEAAERRAEAEARRAEAAERQAEARAEAAERRAEARAGRERTGRGRRSTGGRVRSGGRGRGRSGATGSGGSGRSGGTGGAGRVISGGEGGRLIHVESPGQGTTVIRTERGIEIRPEIVRPLRVQSGDATVIRSGSGDGRVIRITPGLPGSVRITSEGGTTIIHDGGSGGVRVRVESGSGTTLRTGGPEVRVQGLEPLKVDVKGVDLKVEPLHVEPLNVEPVLVEPLLVEPLNLEPVLVEPIKVDVKPVDSTDVKRQPVGPVPVTPVRADSVGVGADLDVPLRVDTLAIRAKVESDDQKKEAASKADGKSPAQPTSKKVKTNR